MMKEKKRYFMAGTNNEVHFGDMIEVDLGHTMPNGRVKHQHIECVFCPELVDMFLEKEVISETPAKEDKLTEEEEELEMELFHLISNRFKDFDDRLTELEDYVAKLSSPKKYNK